MLKTNVQIVKVQTLVDNSLKVTLTTPEMSPEGMTEIFRLYKAKDCACVLQESDLDQKVIEIRDLPPKLKSLSSRLRSTLYVLWEKRGKPLSSFEPFYYSEMEKLILNFNSEINE